MRKKVCGFALMCALLASISGAKAEGFDVNSALEHIQAAIEHKTITNQGCVQFDRFLNFLQETYPNTFEKLEYTPVNTYGILLYWKGESAEKPVLITGHYDTVGVDEKSLKNWHYEPFKGTIAEGKIYGRGVLDDKASFIAIFEAIESLAKENFTPKNDTYFAFGFDEETGGTKGALEIAKYLNSKGLKFEMVLDEGGRVEAENGLETAYIGVSEKGRYAANIIIKSKGAHASRPPKETAVTSLAKVISALNKNQMKPELTPQVLEYYKANKQSQSFYRNFLVKNNVLLRPLLYKELSKDPVDNAYIRATTALTMLEASKTSNVIPDSAQVTGDFRILPSQKAEDVEKHIRKVIEKTLKNADYELDVFFNEPASNVSSLESEGYKKLQTAIKLSFPNSPIVPYMVPGGTDAKHYEILSNSVYRFLPISVTTEEYGLMHNTDEYVSVENYIRMIGFYRNLIRL